MKPGSRFRFRPWLALGIAALHFVIFAGVSWFVLMGALSGSGPGGPHYQGAGTAEIIDMILTPTLPILRLCGIEKLDFQILLFGVVSSSALYGVVISLLISYILSRRTKIAQPMKDSDSNAAPY